MSDIVLRSSVNLTLNARAAARRAGEVIGEYAGRVSERARREQTGQDVLEYAGLLVLVAAIIVFLVTQTNLPSMLGHGITTQVNKVLGSGGSGSGGTGTTGN